jgi:hypothetical protein
MNNVYFGIYRSALETNVTVHDGSSFREVNATELSFKSEGKGKCWVPWTWCMDKHLALLVGHLTLPGVYDFIWRELVGLRGNNSNFWSPATPHPPPADQSIYLSLLDGSIWRSHRFPIPPNSKHINHQRKLFFEEKFYWQLATHKTRIIIYGHIQNLLSSFQNNLSFTFLMYDTILLHHKLIIKYQEITLLYI